MWKLCSVYFFFWALRRRDSRIHLRAANGFATPPPSRKRYLETTRAKKYLNSKFFCSRAAKFRYTDKPVSCLSSSFFSSCFFLYTYIYNTRQRETKKREMPARSTIAMGGADVMTFVRSTRPGFPKGLKVQAMMMIEKLFFSLFLCQGHTLTFGPSTPRGTKIFVLKIQF